ncbi:MAG: hypothetical protein QOG53_3452 [Frankiales bacterium]|nr:hypothetical protein [Frankiales bacterium]
MAIVVLGSRYVPDVAELFVADECLYLRLSGFETALTLCRSRTTPISAIRGVGVADRAGHELAVALGFPFPHYWTPSTRIGRWWTPSGCYLVSTRRGKPVIVIDLPSWWTRRLYVSVENPHVVLEHLPARARDMSDQLQPGLDGTADLWRREPDDQGNT